MTQAVETRGAAGLPAIVDEIVSGLANMQQVAREDGSGGSGAFMKFAKGTYSFGVDDIEVQEGSFWAVNPNSFTHGYQAWGDGELLDEKVAGQRQKPIVKATLPDLEYQEEGVTKTARWAPLRGFQLVCTNGEDAGVECYLASTSLGFRKATDGLIREIVTGMKEDPGNPVPVIELKASGYKHKKYGWVDTPEFEIVDWVAIDATETNVREPEADDAPEDDRGVDASEAESEEEALDAADTKMADEKAAEASQPQTRARRGAATPTAEKSTADKPSGRRRERRRPVETK
jgi:hypothetical protein